jgi:RNA polymerase sigma-70 factor, ECF subfamily
VSTEWLVPSSHEQEPRMAPNDVRVSDLPAYETLVDTHYSRVWGLCRLLLRDHQEAQDVTQETFLKLHQHHGLGRVDDWGAWLTRVAVNAVRDRHRAGWWPRWRRRTEPLDSSRLMAAAPLPDEAADNEALRRRIGTAFAALPKRQREVFALRQVEGLSTAEAAAALGLSEGSVKRHLFRAIQSLRRALHDGDGDPTST